LIPESEIVSDRAISDPYVRELEDETFMDNSGDLKWPCSRNELDTVASTVETTGETNSCLLVVDRTFRLQEEVFKRCRENTTKEMIWGN
jgi:hypothetical protein